MCNFNVFVALFIMFFLHSMEGGDIAGQNDVYWSILTIIIVIITDWVAPIFICVILVIEHGFPVLSVPPINPSFMISISEMYVLG